MRDTTSNRLGKPSLVVKMPGPDGCCFVQLVGVKVWFM